MTLEQRATVIVNEWLNFERGRSIEVDVSPRAQIELRLAIAAALTPSEAVKNLVEAAQGAIPELCGREDVHDDPHGQYTRNKMHSWHVDGYDNGRTSQPPCSSNAIRVALAAVREELGL